MREDLLKGLSPEQIEKVKDCKSSEELLQLARDEGVQLTDEQLNAVSGGFCSDDEEKDSDGKHRKIDSNHNPINNPY